MFNWVALVAAMTSKLRSLKAAPSEK